jgi:succinoglycan biosynthesis protein ExoA
MSGVPAIAATEYALVSVIAPCRNERDHVAAFCEAVAAQQLPPGVALELLIADGRSIDGSREWLEARAAHDPSLRCIDNPGLIVSTGLNHCLARARGEVIVRMDLHTTYVPDYIAECLAALARTGADNVGGPWRAVGEGLVQSAIAAAFQSRWVAGGARSRDLVYEGPADTVYLGCWPRASFERFGGFDETLVRNQDDEHNLRIHRGGGRVWQSARIRSLYRPRATLAQFFSSNCSTAAVILCNEQAQPAGNPAAADAGGVRGGAGRAGPGRAGLGAGASGLPGARRGLWSLPAGGLGRDRLESPRLGGT